MTKLKTILFSSLALGVGLSTSAQAPVRSLSDESGPPGGISVQRQAYGIALEDGVLWGLGPDYKAAFTQGGMEYTPALGSDAPRNQPLRITLQSITRGGTVLYEAGSVPPAAVRDGEAVVYRRARDILEKYTVRADGVELSYVFGSRLPGSGDLVVRARVDTELAFQPGEESGARFLLDGIGGVTIGEVTGIDALDATAPGSLRSDGAQLEMTLPARFVDNAAYPLVLDPLVGTQFLIGSTGFNDTGPAVAYDHPNDVYLVVWRRTFSFIDSDIRAQRVSNAGNLVGSALGVTVTTSPELEPTVADVKMRGRFLVAWQQAPSPFGPWDIACRAFDASNGTSSSIVPVASTPGDETDPDAAGENDIDDDVLLVWSEEGGGIKGTTINLRATGNPTVYLPLTITSNATARDPAISTSGSSADYYVVVWRQTQQRFRAIVAQAMDRNMTLRGSGLSVASSSALGVDFQRPAVDGSGLDFMVAWDRPATSPTDRNVWCRTIRWNGSTLVNSSTATFAAGDPNYDEFEPAVGWLSGKYVVLWTARDTTTTIFDYDIRGAELNPNCQTCGPGFRLIGLNSPTSRLMERTPDIGTQRSGGNFASDRALIVFGEADASPPFTSDVVAQRIEAFVGGTAGDLGGGCGNGGTAGISSRAAVGDPNFRVTLSGASRSATFLAAGVGFNNSTTACRPCTVMNTSHWFVTFPTGPGAASYPLAIPCYPSLVGLSVYFQWAVFSSGASPCSLAPAGAQVSFSNRYLAVVDF